MLSIRSDVRGIAVRPNANTRMASGGSCAGRAGVARRGVRARPRCSRCTAAPAPRSPGFASSGATATTRDDVDLVARSRAFAVVGRHTRCDALLADDPAVALRHLLVRATTPGGRHARAARARSAHQPRLPPRRRRARQRAFVATGPLAMRVGPYALVALPSETPPPAESARRPELVDAPRVPTRGARPAGSGHVSVTTLPAAPMPRGHRDARCRARNLGRRSRACATICAGGLRRRERRRARRVRVGARVRRPRRPRRPVRGPPASTCSPRASRACTCSSCASTASCTRSTSRRRRGPLRRRRARPPRAAARRGQRRRCASRRSDPVLRSSGTRGAGGCESSRRRPVARSTRDYARRPPWPSASRPPSSAAAGTAAPSSFAASSSTPTSSSCASRRSTTSASRSPPAHPNLEGADRPALRGHLRRPRPRKGMDVVLLGLPHKVSAHEGAGAHGDRRAHRRSLGRLPPARPGRLREVLRRRAPLPRRAHDGTFVYGLPELNREAIRKARSTSRRRAASRRRSSSALLPLAKAGCSRARSRSSASPARAAAASRRARARTTPCARTTSDVQAARAPAHPGDRRRRSATRARRTSTLRFVPVSAPLSRGIFATCFAHVDESVDARGRSSALYAEAYAQRAVRARAGEAPARGRRRERDATTPRSASQLGDVDGRQARRRVLLRRPTTSSRAAPGRPSSR